MGRGNEPHIRSTQFNILRVQQERERGIVNKYHNQKGKKPTRCDLRIAAQSVSAKVKLLDAYGVYARVELNQGKATIKAYHDDVCGFGVFLAARGKALIGASVQDIEDYLAHLAAAGLAARSAARKLSALREFYRWLVLDKQILLDPTMHSTIRKNWSNPPRSLSEEEIAEILNPKRLSVVGSVAQALALRDHAILEILYAAAPRASEVCDLNTSDFDQDDSTLFLRGKGNKDRIVPLIDRALEALEKYREFGRPILLLTGSAGRRAEAMRAASMDVSKASSRRTRPHGPLFITARGQRLTRQWIYRIVKTANAQCSPHRLRHSCATHMLDHGADLEKVQELLGHVWSSSTSVYSGKVPLDKMQEVHRRAHPRAQAKQAEAAQSMPAPSGSGIQLVLRRMSKRVPPAEGQA
jgi:integrase/recombinase XerD